MIEFNKIATRTCNEFRVKHLVPDLKITAELIEIAQLEAERLAQENSTQIRQDLKFNGEKVGVDFLLKTGLLDFDGYELVKSWYDQFYNYEFSGQLQPECLGFTQVVWKSTAEIGFGKARNKYGDIYMVGVFYPAGNYPLLVKQNVFPPKDFRPTPKTTTTTTTTTTAPTTTTIPNLTLETINTTLFNTTITTTTRTLETTTKISIESIKQLKDLLEKLIQSLED